MTKQTLRGSGRTTRMILASIDYVQRTKEQVNVVMANRGGVHEAKTMLDKYAPHIKPEYFILRSLNDCLTCGTFNLNTATITGVKQESTFIDHYAIENCFGNLVKELHRYDNPIVSQ